MTVSLSLPIGRYLFLKRSKETYLIDRDYYIKRLLCTGVLCQKPVIGVNFQILGISDGQTLRLTMGHQEVFVTVRVEESSYFTRLGRHSSADSTLSYY